MGAQEQIQELFKLKEHKMKLGLKPTFDALEKLGNPHKNLRFLHITGTNGKGSTAAMIADTLQRAGHKVGLFTSPHLIKFNERIQINRKEIPDEELAEYIENIKKTKISLTFFEYCTIIGIMHFAKNKVDFVSWEVGLGGTLDSTNVVNAEIAIITNIGIDHTNYLGDTVEKIARDKCGIIKKNSKVVTCSDNAGLQWIKEKCEQQGNEIFVTSPYQGTICLLGEFQKKNAGIAKKVLEILGVNDETIKQGIATTKWPGRLEYLDKNTLIDCAHNTAAIKEIKQYVEKIPKRKLILVFGCMKDKNYTEMIKELPKADNIILTKPKIERAINPSELTFEQEVTIIENPGEAYEYAKEIASEEDLVFIVGSCYLIGNIKEHLVRKRETPAQL